MFATGDRVKFEWINAKGDKVQGAGVILYFVGPLPKHEHAHCLVSSDPPHVGALRQVLCFDLAELRREE